MPDSFVAWIRIPDSESEPLRRFRDEASKIIGVAEIDSTTQQETSEGADKAAGEPTLPTTKLTGAASRTSGIQYAASSFSLNKYNKIATDIVTDGTSLWVVNNSTIDKVFKYTVAGSLVSSWTITTPGATSPTGITIDPANVGHIWIVDNGTDRVYQYDQAAFWPTAAARRPMPTSLLAAGNANPQGIADPPMPGDVLSFDGQAKRRRGAG